MPESKAKYSPEEQEVIKRFLLDRRDKIDETCREVHCESKGLVGRWEQGTLRYYRWYDAVIRHMLATLDQSERRANATKKQ